jgi:hypothetical protein
MHLINANPLHLAMLDRLFPRWSGRSWPDDDSIFFYYNTTNPPFVCAHRVINVICGPGAAGATFEITFRGTEKRSFRDTEKRSSVICPLPPEVAADLLEEWNSFHAMTLQCCSKRERAAAYKRAKLSPQGRPPKLKKEVS